MSQLSARAAGLVLALGALSLAGCKSTQERLHDILVDGFQTEPSWATAVCNYDAQGLTNVSVTSVTNTGSRSSGSGTATVSGMPIVMAGMAAPGPCSGTIAFTYSTVRSGTRVTYNSRGRRRNSATYSMQVDGITVTSRTGMAMPGMMPGMMPGQKPQQMPGMMPGMMPGQMPQQMPGMMPAVVPAAMGGQVPMGGATQCAAYARCCTSLTSTPGFEGMASSCAQVTQLSAMGAQGEVACAETLASVRQSLAAMGSVPPGCQ
jgi:hypothetical protein